MVLSDIDEQYITGTQSRYFTAVAERCVQIYAYERSCGNLTNVSTHSIFRMGNLAFQPHPAGYKKPNLSINYVPLSRGCYNPHLTLSMLPFCIEQANFNRFVRFIYQIYSFVIEYISKLFLCIYQLIPWSITDFADGYSKVLNWISYLNIISELPSWSISELTLSIHQNMMYQHDYASLKIRSCYYILKRHYRCRIYVRNLLFYSLGCGGLRVWLKIPRNKNNPLLSKPIIVPAAKHIPIKSNIINQPVRQKNCYGGHKKRVFSYDFFKPYLTPGYPNTLDMKGRYLYANHVDDASLYLYPTNNFVHTQVPLGILFPFLTLMQARNIALAHEIIPGSRCNMKILLTKIENHSCLKCSSSFSIFQIDKNVNQLASIRMRKMRDTNINKDKNKKQRNHNLFPFPPSVPDKNLYHQIISGAVQKMNPKIIREAGCAVCGLLKPFYELSCLKNVKNFLHILQQEGITCVERKTEDKKVHEYSGPVLDYSCSKICNDCRMSIRNGKVPHLALAKGLWLVKVPDELKCLHFVARVRHTCCYVKVASGM